MFAAFHNLKRKEKTNDIKETFMLTTNRIHLINGSDHRIYKYKEDYTKRPL